MSVPATSTLRFNLACAAVDAPVPPSEIDKSVIPIIFPPVMYTEPESWVDMDPRPREFLASESDSREKIVPSPTIKDPSLGSIEEITVKLSFKSCLLFIWFWIFDSILSRVSSSGDDIPETEIFPAMLETKTLEVSKLFEITELAPPVIIKSSPGSPFSPLSPFSPWGPTKYWIKSASEPVFPWSNQDW